ncbi:MAG TPA: hypothetical protein VNQ79_05420 [Blastocatellia bacterium]|nr:hypothetical protein [Blastocatellia bacterium]
MNSKPVTAGPGGCCDTPPGLTERTRRRWFELRPSQRRRILVALRRYETACAMLDVDPDREEWVADAIAWQKGQDR